MCFFVCMCVESLYTHYKVSSSVLVLPSQVSIFLETDAVGLHSLFVIRYCATGRPNTEIKPEMSNTPGSLSNKHKAFRLK